MNTSIKKTLFVSKDHYLAFRIAWAKAVNSEKAKSTLKPGYGNTRYRVQGWITSAHMAMYNLLRDKPIYEGFTHITNKNRLVLGGTSPILGFDQAVDKLEYYIGMARSIKQDSKQRVSPYYVERVKAFIEPFDGLITLDMLISLGEYIPKYSGLDSWSSEGNKIVQKIINNEPIGNIFEYAIDAKKS